MLDAPLSLQLTHFCLCRVVDIGDNGAVFRSLPIISPAIRASVDKMCFQAPFGTKTLFEGKVPVNIRKAFDKLIMSRHQEPDALAEFGRAWKAWLGEYQAELSDMDSGNDSDSDGGNDQPKRISTTAFGDFGSESEREGSTPPVSQGAESSSKPASSPKRAAAAAATSSPRRGA